MQDSFSLGNSSVLLTGANGFVGGAIFRKLKACGCDVTVGGRRRPPGTDCPFVEFDLAAPSSVQRGLEGAPGFDFVIHAAGSLGADCDNINRGGTSLLLNNLGSRVGCWIQLGSAGVYRNNFAGVIDESTPCEPTTDYERSKLHADLEVVNKHPEAIIFRPTMVAGASMRGSPLRALLHGVSHGVVPVVADDNFLNLVHVEDVADAILEACRNPQAYLNYSAFILSDDMTMPSVLDTLAAAISAPATRVRVPDFLMRLTAEFGTFANLKSFNRGRYAQLKNRARFDSARFRRKCPGWPRMGSRQAVVDLAQSRMGDLK